MHAIDQLIETWPGVSWHVTTYVNADDGSVELQALRWYDGPTAAEVQKAFPNVSIERYASQEAFATHAVERWDDWRNAQRPLTADRLAEVFNQQLELVSRPAVTEAGRVLVGLADALSTPGWPCDGEDIVQWLLDNGGPHTVTAALS